MGARVNVRIDANRDPRGSTARHGDLGERLELGLGFDVEAEDVLVERQGHFGAGLADAGKYDFFRGRAGGARAPQFALRDDVHPAPRRARVVSTAWLELAFTA